MQGSCRIVPGLAGVGAERGAHNPDGSRVVGQGSDAAAEFLRDRVYSSLTSSHLVVSGGGAPVQYLTRRRSTNTEVWSAGDT